MKITIELTGTLELEALESALDMFESWAEEELKDPKATPRNKASARAGIALLKRVRGE